MTAALAVLLNATLSAVLATAGAPPTAGLESGLAPSPRRPLLRAIQLTNDFFTFNTIDDDLYTSAGEIVLGRGAFELSLKEIAFTDSDNDLRFDESAVAVSWNAPPIGHWQPTLTLGALRVGEGLLGERTQNAIHRLIDDREVHLRYLEASDYYGRASVALTGHYRLHRRLVVEPIFRLDVAPRYLDHAVLQARLRYRASRRIGLRVGAGVRASSTSFEPLEPWIEEVAPTFEFGLSLPYGFDLQWVENDYGTRRQHFLISYRGNHSG